MYFIAFIQVLDMLTLYTYPLLLVDMTNFTVRLEKLLKEALDFYLSVL